MSDKEAVLEVVQQMPDRATLDEILEEIQILQAIRRGEQAAKEDRVIPHEQVKQRLATLGS